MRTIRLGSLLLAGAILTPALPHLPAASAEIAAAAQPDRPDGGVERCLDRRSELLLCADRALRLGQARRSAHGAPDFEAAAKAVRAAGTQEASPAPAAPPANDNFAARITIADTPYTDAKDTTEATTELIEQQPSCGDAVGKTVWYQFTPASNLTLQADTFGSDFDTVVAVWTGAALGTLSQVACNDDSGSSLASRATFSASSGTTYLFQIGGYEGESGALTFNLGVSTLGGISGTVTAETSGDPLQWICVDVYDAELDDWLGWAFTDASGAYLVGGLPPGSYLVEFYDCNWPGVYIGEWYDDEPSWLSADPVTVSGPGITSDIDAALSLGGSISGTVTDQATGTPAGYVCVDVYEAVSGEWSGWGETDGNGSYVVGRLPSGAHKVEFWDCDWPPRFGPEWYDGQQSFSAADPVPVSAPGETTGINASMEQFLLLVGRTGSGSGAVSSSPAGIACGADCSHRYPFGSTVTLTPEAAPGTVFSGWNGDCAGTGPCVVKIGWFNFVTADFTATPGPSARTISLVLRNHLKAKGALSSPSAACVQETAVEIQRKVSGKWKRVKQVVSDANGRYRAKLKDRGGAYRAVAPASETCAEASSPTRKHRR